MNGGEKRLLHFKVALANLESNILAPMTIRLLHKYGNAVLWYLGLKHLGTGNKCIQNIHVLCILCYVFFLSCTVIISGDSSWFWILSNMGTWFPLQHYSQNLHVTQFSWLLKLLKILTLVWIPNILTLVLVVWDK